MGTTIEQLRERVRGAVITAADDGSDEARKVYNGVVADLSGMRAVHVDPAKRTARAEGGATWGDFNDATNAFGLATTGGIISTTGVAGLTLGGGIGYLARGFGLSCDNLVSAEIVTADGRSVIASENENADLFWAIRGGGGNFGVATALEFRLHPVKDIYGGPMFFELEDAADTASHFWPSSPAGPGPLRRANAPSSRSTTSPRSSRSTSARCPIRRSTAHSMGSCRLASSSIGRPTS